MLACTEEVAVGNCKLFQRVYCIAYEVFRHSELGIEMLKSRCEMLACTEKVAVGN